VLGRIRDIQVFLLIGYCLFHLLQVGHEFFFFLTTEYGTLCGAVLRIHDILM
jgi:hypothetical protein